MTELPLYTLMNILPTGDGYGYSAYVTGEQFFGWIFFDRHGKVVDSINFPDGYQPHPITQEEMESAP